MAQAVVSYVVNKLGDYLLQEASILTGIEDEIQWLESELRAMLCLLTDADDKLKGGDERLKNWVREIRELAYDAEDVIETFIYKVKKHQYLPPAIMARHEVGKKIQQIKARVSQISARRATLGIANLAEGGGAANNMVSENLQARRRLFPHHYDESSIVGLVEEKKTIVDRLLDGEKRRFVISILGMGGLGKTTLAKKVFHSSEVSQHFGICIWIYVSQTYSVVELLKKILKKVDGTINIENLDEEELNLKLCEALKAQGRYLLVMDDVWKSELWRRIETALPDMRNGSRVIFTTRIEDVARSANPNIPPHKLRLLNEEESVKLFLKKAYPYHDVQTFRKELKDVGEKLVGNCHGLPLALEVLGGLLSKKEERPDVWSNMLNKVKWQLAEEGKECLDIIGLSYEQLPYYLKPCYLYVGAFPEDSQIRVRNLTRLWIAEGFIPHRPGESQEATAEDYLDELIQRCMFQVAGRRYFDGSVNKISIHDLMRDECINQGRESGMLSVVGHCANDAPSSSYLVGLRRLAFISHLVEKWETPNLRTLLGFNISRQANKIGQSFNELKLLRVIDVTGLSDDLKLPKEIKNMIHLRYLRWVTNGSFLISPSVIKDLHNLQVVDVYPALDGSSASIGGLEKLKILKRITYGRWVESDMRKFTHLEKLDITSIVRTKHLWKLAMSLQQLLSLTSLCLRVEHDNGYIPLVSFLHIHHLRSLELKGTLYFSPMDIDFNTLPPSLAKLTLMKSHLEDDPMPILEKLPNLISLRLILNVYVGKRMDCSSGGFPRLQRMELHDMDALEEWEVAAGAMPCLTHLSMNWVTGLKMIPAGLQSVTTFQELQLAGMSEHLKRRVRPGAGEDWHKIQHIPSIIIK